MTEEIYIPPECYTEKPWFLKRPDFKLIRQIKRFVEKTGKPHKWPGHTHTQPPKGGRIEYLEEFDLPDEHQISKDKWAPCPCCSLTKPKYCRKGKIAWFPDEAIIRLMGPDCFAALDTEGHLRAMKKLRREQELSKSTPYLFSALPQVPSTLRALEKAFPTVQAVDLVRKMLRRGLPQVLKAHLWTHIKDGKLRLRNAKVYSTISGYTLIDPDQAPLLPRLKDAIEILKAVPDSNDHASVIDKMSLEERNEAAKELGRAFKIGRDIFSNVDQAQQFLTSANVAALRNWAREPDSPVRIYAMLNGVNLLVGRKEHECRRFEIPSVFFTELGTLPDFASIEVAA